MQWYARAESQREAAARLGLDESRIAKLNSNENLFVPRELAARVARKAAEEVDHRLYPDLEGELVEKLSSYLGVGEECIAIGCGADQLIDLLIAAFGRGGVATVHPTYTYYMDRCMAYKISYRYTELTRSLELDLEELVELAESSSLVILNTPNNPTGTAMPEEAVKAAAEACRGLVVVDETYAEFADRQLHTLPLELENTLVIRSFSKAFAAAGARVGYLVAHPAAAKEVRRAQQPYPASGFSLRYASALLDMLSYFKQVWSEVKRVRSWFYRKLRGQGLRAIPSQANFVSIRADIDPQAAYEGLLRRGYLVRVFPGLLGSRSLVRVTLAPVETLEGAAKALGEVVK
ncbi:MAG: hypothetical protein DRN99_04805 [Thermoproteota archaeon]|nr:MAG: hypothetical protein DRN99_04805 [Candidatus Korarchaeota archaeon]